MRAAPSAFAALLAVGLAWGLATPLVKLGLEGGFGPLGVLLWQLCLSVGLLGGWLGLRRRLGVDAGPLVPLGPAEWRLYGAVAGLGIVGPHWISYTALGHLPAGVISIIVSMVPLFALPLALALGMERFRPERALGLGLGAMAVVALVVPQASLPGAAAAGFVLFAMLTPLCYALEGAYVAGRASRRAGPLQTLLGGSALGLLVVGPLALVSGQAVAPWAVWGPAGAAVALSGVVSPLAYAGYVTLLRATGPVFAAQVSYLVTASGVLWAMTLLGERYSGWTWAALALLFAGLFLVQPRPVAAPRQA
ncbi:MAG: DMT family transporter [Alkalilacustris sp.]